ncbi:MAG: alpha/beta fold hydrolase [Roseivirga sp.]|nr:alpha/beta fold hydrolase [Roseivirga sp.]
MKNYILTLCLFVTGGLMAQTNQQFANIGSLTTTSGEVINDCKVGYRTVGKLNAEKTNVVLWTTWFTGTSGQVTDFGMLNNTMDTTGLYVVIIDALTNGVSSSPSNTSEFPKISIRDMVNSQYKLLSEHLEIDHLKAVMGISMGGMQAFEWIIAYPEFMDKMISIVGTPRQSAYDKLVWGSMAGIMNSADSKEELNEAYQNAYKIQLLNMYTPEFIAESYGAEGLNDYLNQFPTSLAPEDYLGGITAMQSHDIYGSSKNLSEINATIKPDLLIIVAKEDHLVNPISSIKLAKDIKAKLVVLSTNCGHMAPFCESEKIKQEIMPFLF